MKFEKIQKILFFLAAPLLLINILYGLLFQLGENFEFFHPQVVISEVSPFPTYISLAETGLHIGRPFDKIEKIILRPKESSLAVHLDDSEVVYIHPRSGHVLKRGKSLALWASQLHSRSFFHNQTFRLVFTILMFLLTLSFIAVSWPRTARR